MTTEQIKAIRGENRGATKDNTRGAELYRQLIRRGNISYAGNRNRHSRWPLACESHHGRISSAAVLGELLTRHGYRLLRYNADQQPRASNTWPFLFARRSLPWVGI